MIENLVRKTRSCRRFFEDHQITTDTLMKLVDLARLSASGGNLQPLKYILSNEKEKNERHTILRKYILYTIASHSCDYAFSTEYNRFRFMLSVVDELEEFSRYSRQGRSDVNEICKSGLEFDGNGNFIIEYLFEKEHIANPLLFFEARAIRISYMIDIDEKLEFGIKSFIMVCIDNKDPSEKRHYEFKMDKDGISCIFEVPKLNKKSERKLDPDTENNLKKFIDEWTEQN